MANNFQNGANLMTVGFGNRPESVEIPTIQSRAPTSADFRYPAGKTWVDQVGNASYILTGFSSLGGSVVANWSPAGGSVTGVFTLTDTASTVVNPTAGNIQIAGTASQITSTAGSSVITLSIPAAFIAPGSIASTTTITSGSTLTATTSIASGTTITAGTSMSVTTNLILVSAGSKVNHTSVGTTTAAGANSIGTVTLVGGTATIATTNVTAASLIRLTRMGVGATGANPLGLLSSGTITPGVSFVINAWSSTDATALAATDVSSILWEISN
jgi:hypothetical protein